MPVFPDIILASQSPARATVLRQIGLPFKVIPSKIDESVLMTDPKMYVLSISNQKAKSVLKKLEAVENGYIIISCDTIIFDPYQNILGKPKNRKEAEQMLKVLSGNIHMVMSGCTILIDFNQKQTEYQDVITTLVKFRLLSKEEIKYYLDREEWKSKAGAYAIQGLGAYFIEKIEGDYYNIVGLPVSWVWKILWNHFGDIMLNIDNKKINE